MAASSSFKVPCPSCEAMVPVRDSGLIGKKIECPKCKFKFLVEKPDDGDAPAGKKEKKSAKSKAAGGNSKMKLIGAGLGTAGVGVLGAVGYMLFGGSSTPPPPPPKPVAVTQAANNPPPPPPVVPMGEGAPMPMGEQPMGEKPMGENPPATPMPPPPPVAVVQSPPIKLPGNDLTNALPDDSQSVMSIHMDRLRNSTLGTQAFESRVGFKPDAFKTKVGIAIEEMVRLVRAENLEQNWAFDVLRTSRPFTHADLKGPLGLTKGDKSPIQGREYFKMAPNELLDNLSSILQSELEAKDAKVAAKKPGSPMAMAFIDPTTLVFANQGILEEFLEKQGKWELRSKLTPGSTAGEQSAAPMGEGALPAPGGAGGGTPPPPPAGAVVGSDGGGAGGGKKPGGPSPGGAEGGGSGPQFTDRSSYLTVDPVLKTALDRLEAGEKKVIAAMAVRPQSNEKIIERVRTLTGLPLSGRGMSALSVVVNEYDNSKFVGEVVADMLRENEAKDFEGQIKKILPAATKLLSLYLGGLKIDTEAGQGGGGPDDAGPGRPGVPPGGSAPPPAGPVAGGGEGGGGPMAPGGPGGEGSKSKISVKRKARVVTVDADLSLNLPAYDKIYALSEGVVVRMRGMVDMSSGIPRWNELGAAGKAQVEKDEKKLFPRGTYSRESGVGDRLSRTWAPNQRVSWMVSLLPFLGQEDLFSGIDTKKSWRDDENLKRGQVLVPQFLNPRYPRPAWRANVPSLGTRDQGATHFVGVAGLGEDAADYRTDDPAVANKLGMMGYNRRTALKDVTDGLSNTIYMIQVRPDLPRPWIAGGGATITGIPEKDCVKPFTTVQANGKRGAIVVMADGSVRMISETISDEAFKKLVTIRGGEEVSDLDSIAPKVPAGKPVELKTEDDK